MSNEGNAAAEVAIQAFADLLRVERLLDKKKQELRAAVARVPREQMNYYVSETEEMRRADEEIRNKQHLPAGA